MIRHAHFAILPVFGSRHPSRSMPTSCVPVKQKPMPAKPFLLAMATARANLPQVLRFVVLECWLGFRGLYGTLVNIARPRSS
jgi:hypothetical protein